MPRRFVYLFSLAFMASLFSNSAYAQLCCKKHCCQQYQIVEEVCYKEVVRKFTVPVPDVKKVVHWVYDNRPEDFALPCCTWPGCCKKCGDCGPECVKCGKPCCRAPLIKRLIIEEVPITKCVVECVVETVPCVTYRKVPCGSVTPGAVSTDLPPGVIVPPVAAPEPLPVMPAAPTVAPHPAPVIQSEPGPAPHPVGVD